jgi:hypothetical protein
MIMNRLLSVLCLAFTLFSCKDLNNGNINQQTEDQTDNPEIEIPKDNVSIPTAIPKSGTIIAGRTIALNTLSAGATIYYTTNGDNPTIDSIKYTGPITISTNTVLKAIAVKEGMNNSGVITENYIVNHVYVVGYVNGRYDDMSYVTKNKACYWLDGQQIELSVPGNDSTARAIAISNNHIYIAGDYNDDTRRLCYWIDGQRTNIPLTGNYAFANDIAVENGYIYVAGYIDNSTWGTNACYWVNGQYVSLPSSGRSIATAIAISNSTVYISGYDSVTDGNNYTHNNACYWVNGQKIDLPFSGTGSTANSIALSEGSVYISGFYNDNNDNIKACYWVDGQKIDLIVPVSFTSNTIAQANAITVENGHVYIAGYFYGFYKTPCYWTDGQRNNVYFDLDIETRSIAVSNNQVFIAGYHNPRACYWLDREMYTLSSSGSYSSAYDIIVTKD